MNRHADPHPATRPVIDIAHRRHANPTLSILDRLRPRAVSEPVDLPFVESQEIAASIPTQPMVSVVDPGRGIDEHTDHNVVRMSRPRKFLCVSGCGEPATIALPSPVRGGEPERYCPAHQPRGILGVVDGGDGAA